MEITIPYQFQPRAYQLPLLAAPQRFKIAVIHRRGGKSKTALNGQIAKTQLRRGVYYYFLPTYRQAKAVMWDELVKQHVPLQIVDKINDSELAIYYKNGSIQRFVGCEDIDKHRGINPIDVVFDEYSEMNEMIWTAIIQPVLRENKGTATFIFTPKGKNHSWKLLQQAQGNPEWFTMVQSVNDTQALSQEDIDEAKRNTPEDLFKQEYQCEFLEGAGAFFKNVKENIYPADDKPEPGHRYKMGVDLAKYQDYTVITPLDLMTFKVKTQERFNQIDYNLQKARIEATYLRYYKPEITLDSTGVGEPIHDDLDNRGMNVVPFKFAEQSRRDLLTNLKLLLEQNKIKIPEDEQLLNELSSFQYVIKGENGKTRIQVPDGLHDDCVMSLALACWELPEKPMALPGSLRFLTNKEPLKQTSYE